VHQQHHHQQHQHQAYTNCANQGVRVNVSEAFQDYEHLWSDWTVRCAYKTRHMARAALRPGSGCSYALFGLLLVAITLAIVYLSAPTLGRRETHDDETQRHIPAVPPLQPAPPLPPPPPPPPPSPQVPPPLSTKKPAQADFKKPFMSRIKDSDLEIYEEGMYALHIPFCDGELLAAGNGRDEALNMHADKVCSRNRGHSTTSMEHDSESSGIPPYVHYRYYNVTIHDPSKKTGGDMSVSSYTCCCYDESLSICQGFSISLGDEQLAKRYTVSGLLKKRPKSDYGWRLLLGVGGAFSYNETYCALDLKVVSPANGRDASEDESKYRGDKDNDGNHGTDNLLANEERPAYHRALPQSARGKKRKDFLKETRQNDDEGNMDDLLQRI